MSAPDPELAALDLAVGKLLGLDVSIVHDVCLRALPYDPIVGHNDFAAFSPSTEWSHGGPIIDREKMTLIAPDERIGRMCAAFTEWTAYICHVDDFENEIEYEQTGQTALIAAMRAFVASKQ